MKMIAVASGKGGVGKSTVAVHLTLALAKQGFACGLLDCDIYGPSIPTMLGIQQRPQVQGDKLLPIEVHGIKTLSMGLLATDDMPVIWRGPMVANLIQQFLEHVEWGELDFLVIDLPPGTGDAQLTLTQKANLDGAVIVTTPQEVALIDARRGLKMFQQVGVPVLGIVENMSYFVCDGCGKRHEVFKVGGGRRVAEELKLPLLAEIPLDPKVTEACDRGKPVVTPPFEQLAATILAKMPQEKSAEFHLRW